ncbi:MAG: TRAP transporter small permease [Deltaproteobacteria bacterium]|nr:TRAP transporter small permease [Deltaproteobacteria bacterium]
MKILKLAERTLARLEGWLIVAFLSMMVVLTFIQVCLRGLFTHGHFQWANALMGQLDWSEPFVRLLVLWLTFLGASLLTQENKHIKIDLLSAILPPKWLPVRELILSLVCVFISAIMLKACTDYIKMEMEFGESMFLQIPNWIGQIILPAGFALILFRFLLRAIDQGLEIARGKTR